MSKILVIEDDGTTRLFLKRDLQLEGYEVTVAKDGAEGLEKAEQVHPAVIICDWMMPNLDGVEVCRRVKANPELETTSFILLSSHESLSHQQEGLSAGADEFLSKPIVPQELLSRVRSGIRQHQLRDELQRFRNQVQLLQQELPKAEFPRLLSSDLMTIHQTLHQAQEQLSTSQTKIQELRGNWNSKSVSEQDLDSLGQMIESTQKIVANVDKLVFRISSSLPQGEVKP